jgi:hypothetical protein
MNRRSFLRRSTLVGLGGSLRASAAASRTHAGVQTFLAAGGGSVTVYGLTSDVFDMSARRQLMDEWCWAACIEMIFHRYGYVVGQPAIVQTVYQRVVDQPATKADILKLLNHAWIDQNGRYFVARSEVVGICILGAIRDLAEERPLIIGTLGHAMVLTSIAVANNVDGTSSLIAATVRDPWPDPSLVPTHGERDLTPQEWSCMSFMARINIAP